MHRQGKTYAGVVCCKRRGEQESQTLEKVASKRAQPRLLVFGPQQDRGHAEHDDREQSEGPRDTEMHGGYGSIQLTALGPARPDPTCGIMRGVVVVKRRAIGSYSESTCENHQETVREDHYACVRLGGGVRSNTYLRTRRVV